MPSDAQNRAARPGSRRVVPLLAAALAAAGAVSIGLMVSRSGGSQNGNGAPPSWLPKASVPVGRVVTASAAHPWLAIEGDSVLVKLPRARALVTVVGPTVPEEGQFPVPPTTPCTFTVSFAQVTGDLPIGSGDFSVLDENGHLHHLVVTSAQNGAVPGPTTRHRLTLDMSAILPTGSGNLEWAPGGGKPIVSWDFDVEID